MKVLDFGLAKQVETEVSGELTQAGQAFGTPQYMSPEQWADSGTADPRADVYGLGLLTYYLLAGRPPFTSSSPTGLMFDHVKTTPELPSSVGDIPIPAPLDAIVMKCLAKQPDDRFQSVVEFETALSEIRFDEPWTAESARLWWEVHQPGSGNARREPA